MKVLTTTMVLLTVASAALCLYVVFALHQLDKDKKDSSSLDFFSLVSKKCSSSSEQIRLKVVGMPEEKQPKCGQAWFVNPDGQKIVNVRSFELLNYTRGYKLTFSEDGSKVVKQETFSYFDWP